VIRVRRNPEAAVISIAEFYISLEKDMEQMELIIKAEYFLILSENIKF
jgi:hypothetical protein